MPYVEPTSLAGRNFTIIGAGTLGRRIALMWLTQGEVVHLFDTNAATLVAAQAFVDEQLDGVIERLVPGGKKGTLVTYQDRSEAVKNAWIVVEASMTILFILSRRLTDSRTQFPRSFRPRYNYLGS